MNQNKGLIIPEIHPDDYRQGTRRSLKVMFGVAPALTEKDLPEAEKQNPGYETSGCVSFNTLTMGVETNANKVFGKKINLADRQVVKNSGTDPRQGNDPKKVAQYIHENWAVFEEEWATKDAKTVEEFYAEVPEEKNILAKARGAEYNFGYEWIKPTVAGVREALSEGKTVCFSVPAWYERGGKYYRPEGVQDGHWTGCYGVNENEEFLVYDSYAPYKKIMEKGYKPTIAMAYWLERQIVNESAFRRFLRLIKRVLRQMQYGLASTIS